MSNTGYLTQPQQTYYSGDQYGDYQYLSLEEIINNFVAAYLGTGKILANVLKGDVSFHAHRALAELSYDTLKSQKSQEIEVCPNLKMPLPQDYVNYVKIVYSDANGIENVLYPASKTSNPFSIEQTQGNCEDCGDTSSSYQYDGQKLKSQETVCSTVDTVCSFSTANLDETTHDGGNQIYQYLNGGGGDSLGAQAKIDYWGTWFSAVNDYCVCLQTSVAKENCGTFVGWDNFNLWDSGRTNVTAEINNKAGWTGLKYPPTSTEVSGSQAVNGGWEDFTTPVGLKTESSNTWDNYKSASGTTVGVTNTLDPGTDNSNYFTNDGERYGLDPQLAQTNGSFFIDHIKGMIHFSSNLSGKTIILKYISDSLGTDDEMVVPKLAEEAIYKWIAYGCAQARSDVDGGTIARFKKEKIAETRKAKLRLSNIKIEEISQVFRGKSKWIKH